MTGNQVPFGRRWVRFSLRSLLAGMLLFCLVLGGSAERARRQKQAFLDLSRNGFYSITCRTPKKREEASAGHLGSGWLPAVIGYDAFTVELDVSVNNYNHRISPEEIEALQRLPRLGSLSYTVENNDILLLRNALPDCKMHRVYSGFILDVF